MELNTFSLHREIIKGRARTQVTFDEDYNLPDYKPDFSALIMSQGRIRIEETKVTKGHVSIKGNLKFEILYRAEQVELGVSSLEGVVSFQETLAVDEAQEFDSAQVSCELEDLSINVTNSRKLGVRALLDLSAVVSEFATEEFPEEMEGGQNMEVLNRSVNCLHLKAEGKDQCRIHEEIDLPANKPNINEILWKQVQIQGIQARPANGKIQVQGEVSVSMLYIGEPEARLEWHETSIPVSLSLEVPESDQDYICYVKADVQEWNVQSQEDLEGEPRVISLDGILKVEYRLYEEQKRQMLGDLYALDKTLIPQREAVTVEHLLMKNESRCKVNDTLTLEQGQKEILQICSCFGNVQLDHTEIQEDGILAEGAVHVQILYFTKEDQAPLDAVEGMLPFSYKIEVPQITPDCRFELNTGIELLSVMMKSGSMMEIQSVADFNVIVFKPEEIERIKTVEETPADMEEIQRMPGMTGLRIKSGDTLWKIAKENHTTIAEIKRTNQLPDEPLPEGTTILLLKQVR
ncbi:Domain of uncharacterised function (DUF3794) [uncultured Roseburia sp.]|uniref:DUF3794 domain-containing protein n=1 Tax=Brotonthovivens ammoniilytica TaxID=2981725 RepID=A0ABT2TMA5_9FIRM|nr:SPOCS domain-containing protein [Brotonthovivens ammoniilytica]MCU6762811.1 DUF3794 domain-containing protein [Brotonthovivens ammoniilytica]SCI89796.1 Domain of uncharacterised function (DUF3794) [uncultured Roseburia sp.]